MDIKELIEKIKEAGEKRREFVSDLTDELLKRVESLEKWLSGAFYDDVIKDADLSGGAFSKKLAAISAIQKSGIWRTFRERVTRLIVWMVEKIGVVGNMVGQYFGLLLPKDGEAVGDYAKNSVDKYLKALGWSGKAVDKGSFFDTLINDVSVERQIKARAIMAIRAGKTVAEFRQIIASTVQGSALIKRVFEQYAVTAFAEADRAGSLDVADRFGMNHAIWSGPKLTTSRPFCMARKGKVFSRKQLEAMDKLNWLGKVPGQSTLISAGGYRCVDILLWISEEMALQLGWTEK